jgi:molybdopterin-guanine dinucleotide biosynthesis protein A
LKLTHVEAAVLAGGASSRMGRDKATLPYQGRAMAERVAAALGACIERVSLVVVVRPEQELSLALPRIVDAHAERAPIVGVCAALRAARAPAVLVAACDLPELDPAVVLALLALVPAEGGHEIVAPLGPRGPEPLLAVYRRTLLERIEQRIADQKLSLQELIHESHSLLVPAQLLQRIDPTLRSLRNVNRPEDLS